MLENLKGSMRDAVKMMRAQMAKTGQVLRAVFLPCFRWASLVIQW